MTITARAIALLREIEWVYDLACHRKFCPSCEGQQPMHAHDCTLAALLAEYDAQPVAKEKPDV